MTTLRLGSARSATRWALLPLVLLLCVSACSGEPVKVTVPPGASLRTVTDTLSRAKLLSMPGLFRFYARLSGRDRAVRPGTFIIPRNSSWFSILDTLTKGTGVSVSLTIPEGFNLASIESLLVQKLEADPISASAATRDSTLVRMLGAEGGTLEGYLFPDTYAIPVGSQASLAVEVMVDRFVAVWDSAWNSRLEELDMTRHQIITLASIIEREAVLAEERQVISSVYHNRLRIGMPLQADPTVLYAKGQHAERVYLKDLEIDSPYNTYLYPGLPPGPIASPGRESIRAALFPGDHKFLYFVAHPDGHHEFRETFAEHLAAKQLVARIRAREGRGGT